MKKFSGSIVVGLLLSSFALAGGDIAPVEPAVVMPAPMVDDSGFYVGGAYSFINAETDTYGEYGDIVGDPVYWWRETQDSDTSGFMLQLGYQFNKYIAVEGRYWNGGTNMDGTSINSDGFTDSWSDDCTDLTAWGIYVKPMYPITDAVSIYGLLGYGNTQIDDQWYGDGTEILDDNGFQWGVGLSYAYDEHISFFVDYVRLANNEGGSYDYNAGNPDPTYDYDYVNWETSVYTVNFGVTYKF
jgi:opacity protein-like surface antigen